MAKITTIRHEGKLPTPVVDALPGQKAPSSVLDIKRVAAYCRVSTLAEEQELSYESQQKYYKALFEKDKSKILIGVYGDQGITGTSMEKRPGFQDLKRDCKHGRIDEVYTKSISRFSRNYKECIDCINELRDLGIVVYFEKEKLSTNDENMDMILKIMAILAQEEANSISQNITLAIDYRNRKGDPVRQAPYGYRRQRKVVDGIHPWKINEDEARRVRLAYRKYLEGNSMVEVANILNEFEKENDGTRKWHGQSVGEMLKNEAYVGDVITNKTYTVDYLTKVQKVNKGERPQYYLKDHHEPIISREDFARVFKMRGRSLPECMQNQD